MSHTLERTSDFSAKGSGDSVFLIPRGSVDVVYVCSGPSSILLWNRLEGGDEDSLVEDLLASFEVSAEDARKDVEEFLAVLTSIGAVRRTAKAEGRSSPTGTKAIRKPYVRAMVETIRLRDLLPQNLVVQGATQIGAPSNSTPAQGGDCRTTCFES